MDLIFSYFFWWNWSVLKDFRIIVIENYTAYSSIYFRGISEILIHMIVLNVQKKMREHRSSLLRLGKIYSLMKIYLICSLRWVISNLNLAQILFKKMEWLEGLLMSFRSADGIWAVNLFFKYRMVLTHSSMNDSMAKLVWSVKRNELECSSNIKTITKIVNFFNFIQIGNILNF